MFIIYFIFLLFIWTTLPSNPNFLNPWTNFTILHWLFFATRLFPRPPGLCTLCYLYFTLPLYLLYKFISWYLYFASELLKKYSWHLLKMVRQTLFKAEGHLYSRCRDHRNGVLQWRGRLEASLNTAWTSGNLSPRSRVEVSG